MPRILIALLIFLAATSGAAANPNLRSSACIRPERAGKIPPALINKISVDNPARLKIWVFFTDKSIADQAGFEQAARGLSLSERAVSRRAKMDIDDIVFADLPVSENYVTSIRSLGAEFRRSSKWLNAASFEIETGLLDEIASLSFVAEVRPVAGFSRVEPLISDEGELRLPPIKARADALDYGGSYGQMNMINAPAMHQKGFKGQNVIVAIFDTGFFKDHEVFAQAISEGRLLAEYDFINDDSNTQNEGSDVAGQHSHGTKTWSTLGGYAPGHVIGPAYGADFVLAKTEDITSETPVEEDNWIAAMEWADSIGADIISSSLGYSDWYTYEDYDGLTAPITIAANTAADLGILVCNSSGNRGSAYGTINAPADAFDILSCGAVQSDEAIASFSSRGPTYDGRIKPEVCAQGVQCAVANYIATNAYTASNGTSFSCPLVAGVAAQILSAHPDYNPIMLRTALMQTADRATTPDNDYGWGIIDAIKAFDWGANFTVDTAFGKDSLTVQFADSSSVVALSRKWYFGDGDSSDVVNPSHHYSAPGSYDVSLVQETTEGPYTRLKQDFIIVVADTLQIVSDSAHAGHDLIISVSLTNYMNMTHLTVPLTYQKNALVSLDSVALGARTTGICQINELYRDDAGGQYAFEAIADDEEAPVTAGTGEVFKLYFSTDSLAWSGTTDQLTIGSVGGHELLLGGIKYSYEPSALGGQAVIRSVMRGDFNNSGNLNLLDILGMISFIYEDGPAPLTIENGDIDANFDINLIDILTLIDILY